MSAPTNQQQPSLYERLGGELRVRKIVNELLDRNLKNPEIGHYFKNIDLKRLKQSVFEFFSMGIGGPHTYTGKDMRTAHVDLGLSENDFNVSNEDLIITLEENGVG